MLKKTTKIPPMETERTCGHCGQTRRGRNGEYLRYMREQVLGERSLRQVAKAAEMTPTHLSNLERNLRGIEPEVWDRVLIAIRKIERARK